MSITKDTTLYDLTEKYPELIRVLVDTGFKRMNDPELRRRFGSTVTIETAALARGLEPNELLARFVETVEQSRDTKSTRAAVRIVGLVPCPIRVPMTNVLESASREFTAASGLAVEYDLQAAYTGTEWLEENLGDDPKQEDLPEIFLSAGFRLFLTDPRFQKLRSAGAFADRTGWTRVNEFAESNGLRDPQRCYTVIGIVPAVFMVNRELLGDRPMPKTWGDVLSPEFENCLALPIGDFDLFDSLILGVHRNFGVDGVKRLARNMYQEMHPAQMVAGATRRGETEGTTGSVGAAGPVITIMPYFFTRTINETSPLAPVWPSDGALAAPILLVTRSDRPEIQPMIDTIAGASMSKVLSRLGLFPSAHPENDDFCAEEHPLQWPGWDALLSPELPELLEGTTEVFRTEVTRRHAGAPV